MRHGSLFSGIGGFDLAAEWMQWENVFQVETDDFCQKVLTKNFPNTKKYRDIKEFNGTEYRGKIDVISGGFPCQPFSIAGKRKGKEDDRYLWHEMFRTIQIIKPTWAVIENVPGILTIESGLVFRKLLFDLESEGYETESFEIPACAKNAKHKRNRIWIVAHSTSKRLQRTMRKVKQRFGGRLTTQNRREFQTWDKNWHEVATEFCRMGNGFPKGLDRANRIKALGNAIVPQVAFEIFKAIDLVSNDA